MKLYLTRAIVGLGGTLAIVAVAAALPGLWSGQGGRDFRPQALNAAVLLFAFAWVLARKFHWRVGDCFLTLFLVEVLSLFVIGHFSGSHGIDYFNLQWLGFLNLFVGLPWLGGFVVAALWSKPSA